MKPLVSMLALLVLSVALIVSSNLMVAQAPPGQGENQPHMNAAMDHLQQAQKELEASSHDKGGHRVKALSLIKQAMSEVQQGIQYDNTHQEKGQPRNK
jgi:hypothetical protein